MKSPIRKSKIAHAILALVAAVLATGVLAASSQAAAKFTYEMCDPAIPGGNPIEYSFIVNNNVAYQPVDSCASPGGWAGIDQVGTVQENPAIMETGVPHTPSGYVELTTMTGFALNFHGNIGHIDEESWPVIGASEKPRTFVDATEPPSALAEALGGGAGFNIVIGCSAVCEAGAEIGVRDIAALEVDTTPPRVRTVEGPLVGGGVLRGHQEIHAEATDVGGGLTSLELKVDGTTVSGTATGSCAVTKVENLSYKGIAADSPSPCPPSLSGTWDVDTSAAPFQNGSNTVQVCASDFATQGSPNTTCSPPQTVEVNNTCTESSVAGGADLSAGFGDGGSDELTVKYGKGAKVEGGLTDQAGDPIPGATICLESQSSESVGLPSTVATATTDSSGNFAVKVEPGANRQLLVGYRHDSFQVAKKLSLGTRVRPTLKVDTHVIKGGRRLKITGKLPKPSPAGRVLVLQGASAHGHDWLTFRKVTTGPKGGFRATYRFTRTSSPTIYRIRALAPRQAGYDYEPGASKPARIKVRP
jgi:hypothetical protein